MTTNFTSSPRESLPSSSSTASAGAPSAQVSIAALPRAAKRLLALLERIPRGQLSVSGPAGFERVFGQGGDGVQAQIHIQDWRMCQETLRFGDIGFAESYFKQYWQTRDLTALLNFLLINRHAVEEALYGAWWGRLAFSIKHFFNRNTKSKSPKNIQAHYDLGNAFYTLWLDAGMNYSSAWFNGNTEQDLAQAQLAKTRRALRMVGLGSSAGQRLLEIGCGWGALAQTASLEFGAHVCGVTLSVEQLKYAQDRMAAAGVQADLRLQDYRDIPGQAQFDAVCSIEMMEAVGRTYWAEYFSTIHRQLKPGGLACIQTIVIADQFYDRYVKGSDFIQEYIFPGGFLPSPQAFRQEATKAGFLVVDAFEFGQDYAHTLKLWAERFEAVKARVKSLGFDDRFERIWQFYLAYCEAAFTQGSTNVIQFTLKKSEHPPA
jgi:cyclopropane-fatty-acyl-phospholipid synthase